MKDTYEFRIQGSADEPYTVIITLSPMTAYCTCPAGVMGMDICKHRSQILLGKDPGIAEGDTALLPAIAEAAAGCGFPEVLKAYEKAKTDLAAVEKKTDNLFKNWRGSQYRFALKEIKTDKVIKSAFEDLTVALNEAVKKKMVLESVAEELRKITWTGKKNNSPVSGQALADEAGSGA